VPLKLSMCEETARTALPFRSAHSIRPIRTVSPNLHLNLNLNLNRLLPLMDGLSVCAFVVLL
jgi:hypothetical protein